MAALAGGLVLPGVASAQTVEYPNRPINLVVGYPPGGSTDLTARVVGAELAKQLGVQVVIEDYVPHKGAKVAALFANQLFHVVIAVAATYAVLRIAFTTFTAG